MHIKKLEKYKKGNFKLKEKHIYAQTKIKKIINHILNKKLIGGTYDDTLRSREAVATTVTINEDIMDDMNKETMLNKDNINKYNEAIINEYTKIKQQLSTDEKKSLKQLIQADKDLVEEFKKYNTISGENYNDFAEPEEMKESLLKMQKSLFDLQIKILFRKANKLAHKPNIKPLLDIITAKIDAMNKHIETQEINEIQDENERKYYLEKHNKISIIDNHIENLVKHMNELNRIKTLINNPQNDDKIVGLQDRISTLRGGSENLVPTQLLNINLEIDSEIIKIKNFINTGKQYKKIIVESKNIEDISKKIENIDKYMTLSNSDQFVNIINNIKTKIKRIPKSASSIVRNFVRKRLLNKSTNPKLSTIVEEKTDVNNAASKYTHNLLNTVVDVSLNPTQKLNKLQQILKPPEILVNKTTTGTPDEQTITGTPVEQTITGTPDEQTITGIPYQQTNTTQITTETIPTTVNADYNIINNPIEEIKKPSKLTVTQDPQNISSDTNQIIPGSSNSLEILEPQFEQNTPSDANQATKHTVQSSNDQEYVNIYKIVNYLVSKSESSDEFTNSNITNFCYAITNQFAGLNFALIFGYLKSIIIFVNKTITKNIDLSIESFKTNSDDKLIVFVEQFKGRFITETPNIISIIIDKLYLLVFNLISPNENLMNNTILNNNDMLFAINLKLIENDSTELLFNFIALIKIVIVCIIYELLNLTNMSGIPTNIKSFETNPNNIMQLITPITHILNINNKINE